MEYLYSVVMTIPVAMLDDANTIGASQGWGDNNFTVPLSLTGSAPATHYGMHTPARQTFVDTLTAAQGGTLPVVDGLTPERVAEVMAAFGVSIQLRAETPVYLEHFDAAVLPLVRIA